MTTKRTDCHRPGVIVPSDYEYKCSFDCGGFEEPPWGFDDVREAKKACQDAKEFGCPGKCGVCGARFRYGDLWTHTPTGDFIFLGHDCSAKYSLLANRPEFDAHIASLEARRKAAAEASRRGRQFARWCAANPIVASVFEGVNEDATDKEAEILRDLASKVRQWGTLSGKQINFAISLGLRRMGPVLPPKPEDIKIPAPVGEKRQTVRGILVSKKAYDGAYGTSIKGTIKVISPGGVWLAWGTLPASLLSGSDPVLSGALSCVEVGDEIELDAKLIAGREPHFALFKRPTNARIIQKLAR